MIEIDKPGLKLRQIRELRNISQEYMAKKIGISTRAYSKLETGETQLSIQRLNEISKILDIEPIRLLGFDEKILFHEKKVEETVALYSNNLSYKLISQYEETIASLKEQISLLKELLHQSKSNK